MMRKITKATVISTTIALLLSSCGPNATSTADFQNINNQQQQPINQSEVAAFASEATAQLVREQDFDQDNLLSQQEALLSANEMRELDSNGDGGISQEEIAENLVSEFKNALKVSDTIRPATPGLGSQYNGPLAQRLPASTFKNNQVSLYIDREEILPMMFETIQSAQESIQMDLFLLGGNIGLQIANELAKKAREGVDVKLTFDPNLGFAGPTQKEVYEVISFLQENNVNFKLYPLHLMPKLVEGPLRNKFQIDHNKMTVVDGKTFIIGGFNLFDIGVINRDLMMKIEGPTAQEASELLLYEWSLGDKFVAPKAPQDIYVVKSVQAADSQVKIVKTGLYESTTKKAMIDLLNNAKESAYLAVLEFSDLDLTKALINAHKRGVDVRVVMDRKDTNDKYAGGLPIPNGFPNLLPARELVKNKVPTRWYDARFKGQELHMKMLVVDGQHLIAGSTNFTRQAFTTFRETSVHVVGGTAPQKMVRTFMEDWLNHSTAIQKLSLKDKIKTKVIEFLDKKYYSWW